MAKKGFENLDPGFAPRNEKGQFTAGPERPPFSIEGIGKLAIERRHELAKQQAIRGLMEAVKEKGLSVASGEAAWGEIIKHRALQAMEQSGRSGVQDAILVGRSTGYLTDKKEVSIESKSINITADATDILLSQFMELYPDAEQAIVQLALFRDEPAKWLEQRASNESASTPNTQEGSDE